MNEEENESAGRYIDIGSDVGFKIVFGNPDNPGPMIGLLNALIPGRDIVEIEFLDPEIRLDDVKSKRVRFDIRCVEKDEPEEVRNHLVRTASIRLDDTKNTLSDKILYIFLQLPVVKELYEGQDFLEQLAYSIRNAKNFLSKPKELKAPYFDNLFESADRSFISETNLKLYDYMIRDEIQIKAEKDFAVREATIAALEQGMEKGIERGREEGREQGMRQGIERGREEAKIETAKALKKSGVSYEIIVSATGLSVDEILSL